MPWLLPEELGIGEFVDWWQHRFDRHSFVVVEHAENPLTGNTTTIAGVVIGPGRNDTTDGGPAAQARRFGFDVDIIVSFTIAHFSGRFSADDVATLAGRLLVDPVNGSDAAPGWWLHHADDMDAKLAPEVKGARLVEIGYRPGVTDREGAELARAARELGIDLSAASIGRRLLISGGLDDSQLGLLVEGVLHNDVVERWSPGLLSPAFTDPEAKPAATETIPVVGRTDDELMAVSTGRRLGLSLDEMRVISAHFTDQQRDPTDAEIETLAQTWSEHCSHKTFRAVINVEGESEPIDGLLNTYLRAATETIDAPWVRSAFVDNAGIVAFDDERDIALKAETHNHPSALEPFGGSNTGVGGVVRDILGVSAKPVAITDILCFGPSDVDPASLPDNVLHPDQIRTGVVAGVGDYGNKIGVPNIAGAIIHDASYTTTPLVFAGCIGILPTGSNPTSAQPGDSIVVLGGAVGRDGIGGATFSSQTMGIETADIAGSSVQIGDPIVEKGLIDVVIEARDAELYSAITDCGAGGLSSAVGEMAEVLGATVDLATVPRKYPGLAPWEVWLSEAQERMVLATPDPQPLLDLAARWQVDAAVIGTFTGDGRLEVVDGPDPVISLDTGFLHDGRPRLELNATIPATAGSRPDREASNADQTAGETLLGLLAHPSIRSNEDVVRTFDHEVLGGTLVRPYGGVAGDAPADGTVLVPPPSSSSASASGDEPGIAIGIGVNVVLGRYDTEAMAWAAVDEAVRNVVVSGADPSKLSLLDNFAWANPNDPEMLGRLVAACRGCHGAALAHGAPFVSGKDSLFNEFVHSNGTPDPVTPTLVITAVGTVQSADHALPTGVVADQNEVWLVGPLEGELGGSHFDDLLGRDHGGPVPAPDPQAADRHRQVHAAIIDGAIASLHDVAEGGIAVAAAEWALGGRLGLDCNLVPDTETGVFGEGPGRYLVEVRPGDVERFETLVPSAQRIGSVVAASVVSIGSALSVELGDIHHAFTSHHPNQSGPGRLDETVKPSSVDHRAVAEDQEHYSPRTISTARPSVLIPVGPGTNRDGDLADAFALAGADSVRVPLTALQSGEIALADHQMLAIPGGFSYGDALGAGRLFGLDLVGWFGDQLRAAVDAQMPIIGICNGFQALVRAGLLPGNDRPANLAQNANGRFECRWVDLIPVATHSPWLDGVGQLRCPIAHGEGRVVMAGVAETDDDRSVALRYATPDGEPAGGIYPFNPNGSINDAAGLVDETGLILGLMPHPEDHVLKRHDTLRGRSGSSVGGVVGSCLPLLAAGVAAV